MTRGIYVVAHHPLSPNYRGGGSAIYHDQLLALSAAGYDMHLWHYAYPDTRLTFDAFAATDPQHNATLDAVCGSVTMTTFDPRVGWADRVRARVTDLASGTRVDNPLFRTGALRYLRTLIDRLSPQFIWAQHFGPAQLAVLQRHVPVVYMHHDWLYRVRALAGRVSGAASTRKAEERVATQAAAVVSGSTTECEQLRQLGCRNVSYIPVAYESVRWNSDAVASAPAHLVHLGGMATTANRVGLERFFEVVWPGLAEPRPELWVIGDLSGAAPPLLEQLQGVTCTGFVSDPTTVLRPFDLHIIAWEHDTGTRTRLPLAFSYGQVVVAVRASVAGFSEARDGENCRLVERLSDMPAVIDELRRDAPQRERLGRAARTTFEASYTRPALLPRYRAVIDAALAVRGNA